MLDATRIVGNLALKLGVKLDRCVSGAQLEQLMQTTRPVTTQLPLIRLGGTHDGGYLVPDDLDGIKTCFSPGIAGTANFEDELAKRGIRSFMADASINSLPINNPLFSFEKKYLGVADTATHMTLVKWVSDNAPNETDLILQMDIEGGEYDVLFATPSDFLRRFRIIVVEFHRLDGLLSKLGYKIISNALLRLLQNFEIVHIHPNNCTAPFLYKGLSIPPVMEFTFLRKDRVTSRRPTTHFPHALDERNVIGKDDVILPRCWYA